MSKNHCARTYFWWFRTCEPHLWSVHLPNWHFSLHLPPLQRPVMCAVDNFQCLILGSLPTSSQERVKRSGEINGERTASHDINTNKEVFVSCSVFHFLAPFSLVFHTPELGHRLKINNLGNWKYVFLLGSFTPSTSGIYSHRENSTVGVVYHYENTSSLGMICTNGFMNPTERITNIETMNFLDSVPMIYGL